MTRKLQVLGLGIAAVLVVSAIASLGASAKTGGHFTSAVSHTTLKGEESGTHVVELEADGSSVGCDHATYEGTASSATVESITIKPEYTTCETDSHGDTTVTMNGCDFTFTIGEYAHEDNTVHLLCPTGQTVEVHTPNCTLTMHAQTPTGGGIAYTTDTREGKKAITADVTVTGIHYTRHNGICIFLGTNGTAGKMTGSVTMWGLNTVNATVDIEATGSKGTKP